MMAKQPSLNAETQMHHYATICLGVTHSESVTLSPLLSLTLPSIVSHPPLSCLSPYSHLALPFPSPISEPSLTCLSPSSYLSLTGRPSISSVWPCAACVSASEVSPRVRSFSDQADRPAAAEERCRLAAREDRVAGFLRHEDRAEDRR